VIERPSGQIIGVPAARATMPQPSVPATPAFGQDTAQLAPAGQTAWLGPLGHARRRGGRTPR
jgi:hypothetical protein